MSRKEKLINKIIRIPNDFTYNELVTLLGYLGYYEFRKGKTSGSRRAFVHKETKHIIRLHKPHPKNTLKIYQVIEIVKELSKNGML